MTRSPLNDAILATSDDMHALGLMDEATREKITLRHPGSRPCPTTEPMTGEEIRGLSERARLSQAVFARHLSLMPGHVSLLERGTKRPTGPTLVLLDVVKRKGIEGIL